MSDEQQLWRAGRLQELGKDECRELLASQAVGRVAFVDDTGPTVLPANFVLADDAVIFRTSPRTELARYLDGRRVAFEVDDIDDFRQSGWSVLVRGAARFVELPGSFPRNSVQQAGPKESGASSCGSSSRWSPAAGCSAPDDRPSETIRRRRHATAARVSRARRPRCSGRARRRRD
jgi:hypothetical protein